MRGRSTRSAYTSGVPTKILLDCDPGHDDAIAILLAAGNPDIDLLAVTTAAGNQTLQKVTRNALAVASIAGLTGVPVAAGCDRPLVRAPETAAQTHGESGLDGPELPAPTQGPDPRHAIDVIIETVRAHGPGEITLVATGALTNLALAVRKAPDIAPRVREVVLMGGGMSGGNWTPAAEFNILIDPEAAHIVFTAGWQVVMVGLDATHQALATPEVVARIAALGTVPARFVEELLEFFGRSYLETQGFPHPPVHDPVAVARVIDAAAVPVERIPIAIELTGTHTLGMTVADRRRPAPDDCRTFAATGLDHARFWDLVVDALERLG